MTSLIDRLSEALPTTSDGPDHAVWCSVLGSDLREATTELSALRAYANAAHWWAEAHDAELEERGDNRKGARDRMIDAECALLLAGYVFENAT